jgi:hypothetical protein
MATATSNSRWSRIGAGIGLLIAFFGARAPQLSAAFSSNRESRAQTPSASAIPPGTILPVVLTTSLSFEKCKPGQALRGKIAQDVPLPNGAKIRRGSTVEGHIAEVTSDATGSGSKVAIQFDKVYVAGQWVRVVTDQASHRRFRGGPAGFCPY